MVTVRRVASGRGAATNGSGPMKSGLFGRFIGAFAPEERLDGRPTSANGASSAHLIWDVPPVPLRAVSVVLTVLDRPAVPELFFWALQASFVEGDRRIGAAHLGLQHHPGYPNSSAANWGGYDESGRELTGESLLRSSLGNPNTCDFSWDQRVDYLLRIAPATSGGWRGTITDLVAGEEVVIRDLQGGGSALGAPVVWSEIFAPCDSPSTTVRWSNPSVETDLGETVPITKARVNYQTVHAGGCSNGTVELDDVGVLQRSGVAREIETGQSVSFATSHFRNI